MQKCICGRGFDPDPTGGTHDAPQTPSHSAQAPRFSRLGRFMPLNIISGYATAAGVIAGQFQCFLRCRPQSINQSINQSRFLAWLKPAINYPCTPLRHMDCVVTFKCYLKTKLFMEEYCVCQ